MSNIIESVSETIDNINEVQVKVEYAKRKIKGVKFAWLNSTTEKYTGRLNLLLQQFKHYCDSSSLAGYKYMTETHRTYFERIIWIILHLTMACTLGILIWNVLQDYYNTPVETLVESVNYPSRLVDFPAVSVCSVNRISRKAVVKFAEQIKASGVTGLLLDEILNLLQELGSLYESSFDIFFKNKDELGELLKKFYPGNYSLTKLMKELTPKCEDIFIKCRFRDENRNCSELFSFRKTQHGFCCTFNYVRESDDILGPNVVNQIFEPYKIDKLDQINGLTFLIDPSLDDYFFPILPVNGWKITIFGPSSYPDNISGGVLDALISPGTENFLRLSAVSFSSDKAVRRFTADKRRCIFRDESKALFNGYTYSDCIVDCKLDAIWYSCGCRPFYYPMRYFRRDCNTSDVDCLERYKSKWWMILPHEIKLGSKEAEIFNTMKNESWTLRCKYCFPTCNDVRYILQSSSINLEHNNVNSFMNNVEIVDHSLVHIFFTQYGTVRLKQDVAYYWYELLSDIGGICGVFIGFSLISAVEIIYFFILSSTSQLIGSDVINVMNDNEENTSWNAESIYWDELKPQGKMKKSHIVNESGFGVPKY